MSNKAAIYARFSSNNQREESIDAQIRAITEYADNNGYVIVESYIDEAFSAKSDSRPAFKKMIDDCEDGKFSTILVHKLDRFARNRYHSAIYKHKLKENNINLISVLEQFTDSPESKLLEALLEALSEFYSENLAREVRKGLKENGYKGIHTGGMTPLGYSLDENQRLIINPDEAFIVKTIFEKNTLEGVGYVKLADYLNSFGYRTRTGNKFTKNSFHDLLKNEKYIGTYVFDKSSSKNVNGKRNNHSYKSDDEIIRVKNNHEAIISEELFNKTQEKMNKNKHSSQRNISSPRSAKENYLLTGILYCVCGSKMGGRRGNSGASKKKLALYACTDRIRKVSECKNKSINKNAIQEVVLKDFANNLFSKDQIDELIGKYKIYFESNIQEDPNEITLKNLKKNLNSKELQLNKLIEIIVDSNSDSLALLQKIDTLEKEIHNFKNEISKVESLIIPDRIPTDKEIKSAIRLMKKNILSGEQSNLKAILRHYISTITVDDKNVHIEYKNIM